MHFHCLIKANFDRKVGIVGHFFKKVVLGREKVLKRREKVGLVGKVGPN